MRTLLLFSTMLCTGCAETNEVLPKVEITYTEAIQVAIEELEKDEWRELQHYTIGYVPCEEDQNVWIVIFRINELTYDGPWEPGMDLAIVVSKQSGKVVGEI